MIAARSGKKLLLAANASTTEQVTLDTSGNVGIGTAGPGHKLEVIGNILTSGFVYLTDTSCGISQVGVGTTLRQGSQQAFYVSGGEARMRKLSILGWGSATNAAGNPINMQIVPIENGATGLEMAFETRTTTNTLTEKVRITADGSVGIGTTTPSSTLHVNGGMQIGSPTGGDKGAGSINVSDDVYKNGTAYNNPDYVFHHHFTGANDRGYRGMLPLEHLEKTLRTERQLPGIGREAMGVFARQDVLLEKLEEAYLYIAELARRVTQLESNVTQ